MSYQALPTEEDYWQFIEKDWPELAAIAWEGHQAKGRGVVVLDETAEILKTHEYPLLAGPPVAIYYRGDQEAAEAGGWLEPGLADLVQGYDPHKGIIAVAVRDGQMRFALHADTSKPEFTPPAMAARRASPAA